MDLYAKRSFSSTDGPWQLMREVSEGVAWIKLEPSTSVADLERQWEKKREGKKERGVEEGESGQRVKENNPSKANYIISFI